MLFKKKRSLLNNYGGSQSPTPSFVNLLTNTLVPTSSVGSSTPTFIRATTAYVQDWEGLYKPVLSGEARFTGARRVVNGFRGSYSYFNMTATATGQSGYKGSVTAVRLRVDNAGIYGAYKTQDTNNGFPIPAGGKYIVSIAVCGYGSSIGKVVGFGTYDNGTVTPVNITLSANWQRVSFAVGSANGGNDVRGGLLYGGGFGGSGSTVAVNDEILIDAYQIENTTGQTVQQPAEFVSYGVLNSPYHGAGVDGVKYFTTLNGNTVSSNVVTEATGAMITSAASGASSLTTDTYGPFGYLAEGARTNLALQSQTFGTTWVALTATVTENQVSAPDGTTTADLLTAGAGIALHGIYQPAVLTSNTTTTFSVYAKGGTSSNIAISMLDASVTGGYVTQCFTLSGAGTVGQSFVGGTSGTLTAASITALPNGWYRLALTGKVTFATTNYIQIAQCSASGNTVDVFGQINNSPAALTNYIWGAQVEAASFASSYIPTTTVSVTRNADNLNYVSSGNITAVQGTLYAEAILNTSTPYNTGMIVALANATTGLRMSASNTVNTTTFSDGTIATEKTGLTNISTAPRARAATWVTGGLVSVYGDGNQTPATNNYTAPTITGIGIGNDTGGTSNWFGNIRNVRIYSQALTAAQVARIPTL
jgi:hypothetical protein